MIRLAQRHHHLPQPGMRRIGIHPRMPQGRDAYLRRLHWEFETLESGRHRRAVGKTVAETDCDAPWILLKPTAGKYTATATLIGGSGQSRSVSFTTSGSGRQQEVTIMFARTGQGQGQATQAAQ